MKIQACSELENEISVEGVDRYMQVRNFHVKIEILMIIIVVVTVLNLFTVGKERYIIQIAKS